MKTYCLLFALLTASASGENLSGTIQSIDQNQMKVKTNASVVTLHANEKTIVRKAKTFHDLSALKAGDEIRFTCYGEGSELTAVNISARATLSGTIAATNGNSLTVLPATTEELDSGDRKKAMFVFLHPDTKVGISRTGLTAGKKIHVEGWDVSDGVVEADRIAIYNTDLPVRPPLNRPRN